MRKFKNSAIVRLITVVILIALAVAFTVSYYTPIQVNKTMTVFSKDGLSSDVQLNLTLHRSFFKPTVVRGQIELNGVKYVDWTVDDLSRYNIFERLIQKSKGITNEAVFVNESNFGKGQDVLISDLIWIIMIKFDKHYSVKQISFLQTIGDGVFWNSEKLGA